MDARIDPAAAFGIDLGDAHVIRNAGGIAKDAIRSIVISEQLLGTTEVIIVKHTGKLCSSKTGLSSIERKTVTDADFMMAGCGMLTFSNDDIHGVISKNLPEAAAEGKAIDFLPFPELESAVKADVEFVKSSKLVPDSITVSGWVYEVETGKTKQVV
jgi:carbonic anhydrase